MERIDPPFTRASERGAIEEELYRRLAEHVGSEAEFIASYKQLAEAEDTPEAARYLIRIILEDEERHHRVFRDLTAAVKNILDWSNDSEAVPYVPWGAFSTEFVETTERFLAAERKDEKELRHLRKELQPYRDVTLWPLLVSLMEHDTAKHIELLTFLHDHGERQKK